ncbi:NAD-dependent epimerase/dehydratase family protein [Mycolicibacterium sphagni]|uniref:Epimerase n=1 Tax=Mycolicibacterium sphagni TaxID=1786 RepID=A0A255DGU1_9MYCO|nr:NAD-dependent epimerase/dehydratase family protein [Mycolicibacterium sphagni]MCV7177139.1 NAD-dependent epimerase/dehydratase family protein [Mycolicibacterium sphagni]OYN78667.1 epimerase [Mycolicibacterium sphagni]
MTTQTSGTARPRVMVTGGAGFVGRELVRTLRPHADVQVADLLRYGTPDWLQGDLDGFTFRRVDIRDVDDVRSAINEFAPDVIVHLAAIHYIPECDADPANAVTTNVTGTVNVLSSCPRGTRFVFASSGAVYKPDEEPHRELTSTVEPVDIYGLTKAHGEAYVHLIAADRDLSCAIVRLFNVIGPGETNPHLLPEVIAQLRKGPETIELGNTWPKRDYIDARDAAGGFAAAALGKNAEGVRVEIVNLGSGKQHSVDEILSTLRSTVGLTFEVRQDPKRVRAVDRPYLGADISRIKETFGWSPAHSLQDTLTRLWESPEFVPGLEDRLITRPGN